MSTPSEFYLACRNGDLVTVQHLLPNISYEEKNRIELNGNTALHAATYFGHYEIVKLLLANGCATWIRNKYENTPYDEAKDEEMRKLFDRSDRNNDSNRFASSDDFLSIIAHNTNTNNDESEDDGNIPKRWIDGYKNIGTSEEREATVEKIVHAQMMKYCLKKFQVSDTCKDTLKLLKKSLSPEDKDYVHAQVLLEKIRTEKNVNELILLYTLETSFYGALQKNVDSFSIELYSCLSTLEKRAFKNGSTYRGLTMDDNALKAYRWAAKNKGRMIEIKTMTSTSQLDRVAIGFAEMDKAKADKHKHAILCVFQFSDVCYTAIDLVKDGVITKYYNEEEVLLLPGTLFEVETVTSGPKDDWYTIQLKNISVPYKTLMKSINELKTA